MNNLSIILYIADITPKLAGMLQAFVVLTAILSITGYIVWFMMYAARDVGTKPHGYIRAALGILCLMTLLALIPSKETIYLIAASEAGEAGVASEAGREMMDHIREVIRLQIEEMKGVDQ